MILLRKFGKPIAVDVNGAWIKPGKKAGPAGRADRALGVCPCKCYSFTTKSIEIRRVYVGIVKAMYSVVSLLISAYPQDVWLFIFASGHIQFSNIFLV
jgi:hypothetical protein